MPEEARIETGQPWAPPSAPPPGPAPSTTLPGSRPPAPARSGARREFRQRPIPLRPLSVLELIDGAVGAVPSVPRALLLRAAAVDRKSVV